MAEGGYRYSDPDALDDDITDQLDSILHGREPEALVGQSNAPLTDLRGFEVSVAALSTACEEEVIDPVVERIEIELFGPAQ